ncbi:TraR/DksA family transcriptional regulator [Alteromonas sediminis]|uniref:TraR/DksA family transcriptional regulator n=1 Tax=Alteromonas sediminis TaxID=2259342 RepID=A0A3N5XWY8_9ALTE|nr:TraR/DksA family transcriptional regulator [Alteromonas sediminis]RPJ65242.1 TraR/DksA family transcriptional regulator [Alteromonas sediminis]
MGIQEERLLALRAELTERVNKIDKDFHSRETSSKFSEQVTGGQNDDVLHNLKNEAQFELEQIEHALVRLRAGEYGVCEKCGADIAEARLTAVPYATHCRQCAA